MTRVAIATGVRVYGEGLAAVLDGRADLTVAGITRGVDELLDLLGHTDVDVALLDMGLPRALSGVRLVSRIHPSIRIVTLAVEESDDDMIRCAEAGAAAFLARHGSLAQLLETMEGVSRGEVDCAPRITAALIRRLAVLAREQRPDPSARLTERELEIVELIDEGLSNKEIAGRLSIGLATVKNHVHNVLEKLGAHGRAEAAARIRRQRSAPWDLDLTPR